MEDPPSLSLLPSNRSFSTCTHSTSRERGRGVALHDVFWRQSCRHGARPESLSFGSLDLKEPLKLACNCPSTYTTFDTSFWSRLISVHPPLHLGRMLLFLFKVHPVPRVACVRVCCERLATCERRGDGPPRQGPAKRWSLGCENAIGKARQE